MKVTELAPAKLNLTLEVGEKRADGYHDLQSVMSCAALYDEITLESGVGDGITMDCDCPALACDETNLCVRAARLFYAGTGIGCDGLRISLKKRIPMQAGLGGGSADGAFMIRLLDERFRLNIGIAEMERYAAQLGSDCPFFITAEPSFATGRGELLEPADGPKGNLDGYYIAVVKPDEAVSTAMAYKQIKCRKPAKCCRDVVRQPIDTWKDDLSNDFEEPVFKAHPRLASIKQQLYDLGAVYAQMSGSGSALFGIFRKEPTNIDEIFSDCFTFTSVL